MHRITSLAVLLLVVVLGAATYAGEPAYREIQFTAAYGLLAPSGDWEAVMDSGEGISIDMGMAVTRRVVVGLHFGFGVLDTKFEQIGPLEASTIGNDWTRYVGGGFGEYRLSESTVAPFVGAGLGVHAVHVAYTDIVEGVDGQGDYGLGYSLSAGLRYRGESRFGGVVRIDLENAPEMTEGWITQVHLGVRMYL